MTKITRINPYILPSRKKIRVAAYARVSADYEKNIESLNNQISYYTSLIQKNLSWQYTGVYYDINIHLKILLTLAKIFIR